MIRWDEHVPAPLIPRTVALASGCLGALLALTLICWLIWQVMP